MVPDASYAPLRRFILDHTDLTTLVLAYQGGNRPALPYATLHLLNEMPIGRPQYREFTDDQGQVFEAPAIEREWTWQLDVFGNMPPDIFAQLKAACHVQTVAHTLKPFHIHETSIVRHLPELIDDGEYEDRANMDIVLRGTVAIDFAIDDVGSLSAPDVTGL